jgi:UDPglucose 6-dehydrogenase
MINWPVGSDSFWNEIRLAATKLGVDATEVAAVVRKSAEAAWSDTYGTLPKGPYGGKCLPKDVEGYLGFAEDLGVPSEIARAVSSINQKMTTPESST